MDRNITKSIESIVAYIDILGFSNAVESANEHDFLEIQNLLRMFAARNTAGEFSHTKFSEGHSQYICTPKISNFSDHVVFSHHLHDTNGELIDPFIVMGAISMYVSVFGFMCLEKGFLIRGGISCGNFVHEGNVLFGKPLIKAHELESKNAFYPRVIVDTQSFTDYRYTVDKFFFTDHDGLRVLLWLNELAGPLLAFNSASVRKLNELAAIISRKIAEHRNNSSTLSKWVWFGKHFNEAAQVTKKLMIDKAEDFVAVNLDPALGLMHPNLIHN